MHGVPCPGAAYTMQAKGRGRDSCAGPSFLFCTEIVLSRSAAVVDVIFWRLNGDVCLVVFLLQTRDVSACQQATRLFCLREGEGYVPRLMYSLLSRVFFPVSTEALYIPEGWWHQVTSSSGTVAVNVWFKVKSTPRRREPPLLGAAMPCM